MVDLLRFSKQSYAHVPRRDLRSNQLQRVPRLHDCAELRVL